MSKWLPPMKTIRLSATVCGAALLGMLFIGDFLMARFHATSNGGGNSPRCALAGAIIGVLVGLGCEILRRLTERPGRFTVRDLFLGMSMLAVAVAASTWLIHWASADLVLLSP